MDFTARAEHQRIMKLLKSLIIANIILMVTAFYLYVRQAPAPAYAVYENQGKNYKVQMVAFPTPLVNRLYLLQWVSLAVTTAFTYDAANYQTQLNYAIGRYFTPTGGKAFLAALRRSGAINELLSKKLVVTSVVNGAPIIVTQGPLLGKYTWKVQVPISVTYQSASELRTSSYIATLLIVYMDPKDNPLGIGIQDLILSRGI